MSKDLFTNLKGKLISKDKEDIAIDSLKQNDVIGLYFSAHWCPPCRGFTPILDELYTKWKAQGKKIEIIFVTCDNDANGFKDYFATMPWVAFNYGDKVIDKLGEVYGIQGIPSLLIFNKDGKLIDEEGRMTVVTQKERAFDTWKK